MKPNQVLAGQPAPAPRPETSPLTILGWLLICFALIPLLMGGRGEGQVLLLVGGALAAVGVILVLVGRRRTVRAARATLKA